MAGSQRERRERVAAALFSRVIARAAPLDDGAQAHLLTHSRMYLPTNSLTNSHTNSHTNSLTYSLACSHVLTHSRMYLLTTCT